MMELSDGRQRKMSGNTKTFTAQGYCTENQVVQNGKSQRR